MKMKIKKIATFKKFGMMPKLEDHMIKDLLTLAKS